MIALWLGHESIETTHVYLEADLAIKERALQKLAPLEGPLAGDVSNMLFPYSEHDAEFIAIDK